MPTCPGVPCETCAQAAGAVADGTCTPLSGAACDDGDPCTQNDVCQAGACTVWGTLAVFTRFARFLSPIDTGSQVDNMDVVCSFLTAMLPMYLLSMTSDRMCSTCSRPMGHGLRPFDDAHVVHIWFCPKCRVEETGDITEGVVHVEPEWHLRVSLSSSISPQKIRALRRAPELVDVPLAVLMQRIRQEKTLTLGPYGRSEVEEIRAVLKAAGWTIEMI